MPSELAAEAVGAPVGGGVAGRTAKDADAPGIGEELATGETPTVAVAVAAGDATCEGVAAGVGGVEGFGVVAVVGAGEFVGGGRGTTRAATS